MAKVELTLTGEVKTMPIGPEDAILIKLNDPGVTVEIAEDVREKVKKYFPNNVILVCGPKVEFEVLREGK